MRVRVFFAIFIIAFSAHAARRPHKLKVLCAVALSCISCGNQNLSPNTAEPAPTPTQAPESVASPPSPAINEPRPSSFARRRNENVFIDATKLEERSDAEKELERLRLRYRYDAREEGIIESAFSGLNNSYLTLKALDDIYFSLRPYTANPLAVRALERVAQRHFERGNILYAKAIWQEIGQPIPETLATSKALTTDAQVSQEFASLQVPEEYVLSSAPLVVGDRVFVTSINTKDGMLSRFLLTFNRQTGTLVYAQDYGISRIYEYAMASKGTYIHFLFLFANRLIWVDSHGYDEFNFRGESLIHIEPDSPRPEWQSFMQANASLVLEPSWQLRRGILHNRYDQTFPTEEGFSLSQTWRGLRQNIFRAFSQGEEVFFPLEQGYLSSDRNRYSNTTFYIHYQGRVSLIDLDNLNVRWTSEKIASESDEILNIVQLPNKDILVSLIRGGWLLKLSFETGEVLERVQTPLWHINFRQVLSTSNTSVESLIVINGVNDRGRDTSLLFDTNTMRVVATMPLERTIVSHAWLDSQNSKIYFIAFVSGRERLWEIEYDLNNSTWQDQQLTEAGTVPQTALGINLKKQTILLLNWPHNILEVSKAGEILNRYSGATFFYYNPERNLLLTSQRTSLVVYDLENNQVNTIENPLQYPVVRIDYDDRKDKIFMAHNSGVIDVIDMRTSEVSKIYIGSQNGYIVGPASRNGKNGFLAYSNGSLFFWDYDIRYNIPIESIVQGFARETD